MAGQTSQLAELLQGEGAYVRLVQTNAPYRPAWIRRFRGIRALVRLIDYVVRLWAAAGDVQLFHVMANSGWSWHLFAAPAVWIGRIRGVRVVVNYRGGEAKSFLDRSARWVRPSLNAASALVVPSGFLEGVFRAFGFRSQVVPNVVDLARFRPTRKERPLPPSEPVILVARNLEPIYDNATAIRAFALASARVPARLVIAGSGPEEGALKALAQQLGVHARVEFTGRLDRAEMAARYGLASVALNPSQVDNTPNSILEALASGIPIVSTNVGGIPFIVSDEETALLVPPGDPERMAAALVRMLTGPDLALRLATAGLSEVRRFSWPQVKDSLGSVYQSILAPEIARGRPA